MATGRHYHSYCSSQQVFGAGTIVMNVAETELDVVLINRITKTDLVLQKGQPLCRVAISKINHSLQRLPRQLLMTSGTVSYFRNALQRNRIRVETKRRASAEGNTLHTKSNRPEGNREDSRFRNRLRWAARPRPLSKLERLVERRNPVRVDDEFDGPRPARFATNESALFESNQHGVH